MAGGIGEVYSIWASQLTRSKLLRRVFGRPNVSSKKVRVDHMLA